MAGNSALFDWRPDGWEKAGGLQVGFLVASSAVQELGDSDRARLSRDLRSSLDADRVDAAHIDPSVGAGGYGAGFWLQFLSVGADLLAWTGAYLWLAPRLRSGVALIRERLAAAPGEVALTGEAAAILVVADLAEHGVLRPEEVTRLELVTHQASPLEPRVELQQLYSIYSILLEVPDGDYLRVHHVSVTCHGRIVANGSFLIPIPNHSHWTYPTDIRGGRLLNGLE